MKSGFGTENDVGCTDFVIFLRFWKAFLSKMCSELLCHGLLLVTAVGTVTSNLKRVCRILCTFQLLWHAYLWRGLSRWSSRTANKRYPTSFTVASMTGTVPRLRLFLCTNTTSLIGQLPLLVDSNFNLRFPTKPLKMLRLRGDTGNWKRKH
jgi:hypothetical protein